MLTGIAPNMPPALLYCLARMDYGDELVIADSNYPCESTAIHCVEKELIHLPSMNAADAISLITSVMPLDYFTEYAVLRMEVDNKPAEMTEAHEARPFGCFILRKGVVFG